jgi:hypothetical protein
MKVEKFWKFHFQKFHSANMRILWLMKHAMGSRNKNLYEVYVKNIKLGQLSLEMKDKSNVMNIDCGSTKSYLVESIFKPVNKQVSIILILMSEFLVLILLINHYTTFC